MNNIKFRMVAYTGAAGKYDPDAPMCGNEDNFYVDDNLSDKLTGHCVADEVIDMNDCGVIMAVCDGMGGMNAGEVASAIAVETIKDYFSPNRVTLDIARNPKDRKNYLEKLVIEADKRIKDDAKRNPKHDGMGSTIILAWIVDDELTLTWCGDSRAYKYNPMNGLTLLSEDHSYVQELVNKGLITYEDTFEHPQGNIITRSLGDPGKKAKPETREFSLYKDEIILLCSDGLSGVLRDRKTKDSDGHYFSGENIEDIIKDNTSSMVKCKNALWDAAQNAEWYDNVTILLYQILEGPEYHNIPKTQNQETEQNDLNKTLDSYCDSSDDKKKASGWNKTFHLNIKVKPKKLLLIGMCILILCIIAGFILCRKSSETTINGFDKNQQYLISVVDSLNESLSNNEIYKVLSIGKPDSLSYFKEIKFKISNINDSTGLANVTEDVNRFKDGIKERIEELNFIEGKLKNCEDENQRAELKELEYVCVIQSLTMEDVIKRVEAILKNIKPTEETTETRPVVPSIEHTPSPSPLPNIPPELTPANPELTPAPQEELEEPFVMKKAPECDIQIKKIIEKHSSTGQKVVGIFKNGKKVEREDFKAGETYIIKFQK